MKTYKEHTILFIKKGKIKFCKNGAKGIPKFVNDLTGKGKVRVRYIKGKVSGDL